MNLEAYRFFRGESGACPAWVRRTVIMRTMGWSYQEYRATPARIVEDVERTLTAEAEARRHMEG